MIHPIIYYCLFFLVLGGAGMYIANRKASPVVRRQRWLKYFIYILITTIVITSILYHWFDLLAIVISGAGFFELIRANYLLTRRPYRGFLIVLLCFAIIATGFFEFARTADREMQLFIYFQVFIFDAFSQVTGQIFGKRVLAKKISPSKTIEGFVGGTIFCIGAAILGRHWVNLQFGIALLAGVLTATTALSGDLLASRFKRLVEIKDYSNILPGQGGFLDRFDSLIATGAIYYIILLLTTR